MSGIPPYAIPGPTPSQIHAAEAAERERKRGDLMREQAEQILKRVRFTKKGKWVFQPITMLWHGQNNTRLTWEQLEPEVVAWEAEREERSIRKSVMHALLRQTPDELKNHLRMCELSLTMAKEMGLTTPTPQE